MSGETMHIAQELASGKLAVGVSVGTVTSPAWVSAMHSDTAAAAVMVLGAALSLVILCVNLQLIYHRATDRAERKRLAKKPPNANMQVPQAASTGRPKPRRLRKVVSQRDVRPRRWNASTTK